MSKFFTSICQRGDKFLVREVVDGERHKYIHRGFEPDIFVPSNNPAQRDAVGVDGTPLARMECTSIYAARDIIDSYKGVDSFDVYGTNNWITQFITKNYSEKIEFDSSLIRVFNVDIEVYSEHGFPYPEQAAHPINLIQLIDSFDDNLVRVWGCEPFDCPEGVIYTQCSNESVLIRSFLEYWEMNCPDVMTGWNIKGFDVPYIMNRTNTVLGIDSCNRYSPWKNVRETKYRSDFGQDQLTHIIDGVAVLDYIDLYKKYTYANLESYTLDHVAYVELGERKVDYSDVGTLHGLCNTDYQKFVEYGIKDVYLVDRLDDKMKLIDLVYTLGYMTKQNYTDTFSPVKSWEALIYNHMRTTGRYSVVKSGGGSGGRRIAGAFVKTPVIGKMKEWVLSFDLNSLYPHLIAQYNIGAETLVPFEDSPQLGYVPPEVMEGHIELNSLDLLVEGVFNLDALDGTGMTMAANGAFFRTDKQSILSELMMYTYSGRKEIKREMLKIEQKIEDMGEVFANEDPSYFAHLKGKVAALDNEQMALKILMNSGYGACANKYFQFYDPKVAEAITLSGQLSIKWIERHMNEHLNKLMRTEGKEYVIYADTDSIYIELGDLVNACYSGVIPDDTAKVVDFLDTVASEQLEPFIETKYNELAVYMRAFENKMVMKREVIASRGFWTAKKRYALYVYDSEGVRFAEPKTKVMGLEIVKSSTPEKVRADLKSAVKLILTADEKIVISYIEEIKKKFMMLTPEEMASPRGANNLGKYVDDSTIFGKGTPKHVKAALIYNYLVKKHDLDLEPIGSGNKIKFIDLKSPNPCGQAVIGWPSHLGLPGEFGLTKYIDKNVSYEKTFLKPMETMLSAVGWKSEEIITLEDFF